MTAWSLTTSGASIIKAGLNASSLLTLSGTYITKYLDEFYNQSEATLNALTRRDWVTLSGATTVYFKQIINDTLSDMIAMKIVAFDMSGYSSLGEAQTILDVLRDNINRNVETLKDEKNKEKML